jgi:hypothetical protein
MMVTVEIKGRVYSVNYTTDTLIPEDQRYIDHVEAIVTTPKGVRVVTSARILNRICQELEEGL